MPSPIELLPAGVGPDDPQWHEVRRHVIGASEIAAVLGLSPWQSAFSLWWSKREGWTTETTEDMRTGTRLEPVIAEWWADECDPHENLTVVRAGLYAHPDRPWQTASPDRLIIGPCRRCDGHGIVDSCGSACPACHGEYYTDPLAVLECKWTGCWDGWGDEGTDQIPVYYRCQVLWQCDVMGVDQWHVAVLGPGGFRAYEGGVDQEDLAAMREAGQTFMNSLAADQQPDVDSHHATTATLKQLHPTVDDIDVEIPAGAAQLYADAQAAYRTAKTNRDAAENHLRHLLGDAHRAVHQGQTVATRSVYETRRINTTALRAEMPEIAAQYTTTSTVDKLTPARAKKEQ